MERMGYRGCWIEIIFVFILFTFKHSSRMRTAYLATVRASVSTRCQSRRFPLMATRCPMLEGGRGQTDTCENTRKYSSMMRTDHTVTQGWTVTNWPWGRLCTEWQTPLKKLHSLTICNYHPTTSFWGSKYANDSQWDVTSHSLIG